jgi:hypothetical protein
MNRFYTDDKTKWAGRLTISPGRGEVREGKRIDHFIFDAPDDHHPVARLKRSYVAALESVDAVAASREATTATGKFLPLGITEVVLKHVAEDSLPKLRRAAAAVEKVKADIAARRASLAPNPLPPEGKEERAEIRARLSRMNDGERFEFINKHRNDETMVGALIESSPLTSGIDPDVQKHLRAEQIERQHGETLSELVDIERIAEFVEGVTKLGREEIREIAGVDRGTFEKVAAVAESNGGKLPFKVENEVVDGQMIEVARVLDLETKTWRRATHEEIAASAQQVAA